MPVTVEDVDAVVEAWDQGEAPYVTFNGPSTACAPSALSAVRAALSSADGIAAASAPLDGEDFAVRTLSCGLNPSGPDFRLIGSDDLEPLDARLRDYLAIVCTHLSEAGWQGTISTMPVRSALGPEEDASYRGLTGVVDFGRTRPRPWPSAGADVDQLVEATIAWLDGFDGHDYWGGAQEPVSAEKRQALLATWLADPHPMSPLTNLIRRVSAGEARTVHFTLDGHVLMHACCRASRLGDCRDQAIQLLSTFASTARYASVYGSTRDTSMTVGISMRTAGYVGRDGSTRLGLGAPVAFGWQIITGQPTERLMKSKGWVVTPVHEGAYEVRSSDVSAWFSPDGYPMGVDPARLIAATQELGP